MSAFFRVLTIAALVGLSGCYYMDDRDPGAMTPNNEAGAQPTS